MIGLSWIRRFIPQWSMEENENNLAKLFAALSKFQGEIKPALKGKQGYGYKYADIAAVLEAAQEPLAKHGLCVTHLTQMRVYGENNEHQYMTLQTILGHVSGGHLMAEYLLEPVKKDPQGYGSAVTYARRYSFMAVTGLPVADDDGAYASGKPAPKAPAGKDVKAPKEHITESEKNEAQSFLFKNADMCNKYLRSIKWIKAKENWNALTLEQLEQIGEGLDSFEKKVKEHGAS